MFEELKDYIASHTKELLSNYAKAENEFFTAIETIRKNKEILIKDFEEKNPGYYVKDIHTYPKPNITIYSKKDNKLIKSCVFGKYNL